MAVSKGPVKSVIQMVGCLFLGITYVPQEGPEVSHPTGLRPQEPVTPDRGREKMRPVGFRRY